MRISRALAFIVALGAAGIFLWMALRPPRETPANQPPPQPTESRTPSVPATGPLPGEALMVSYGDPSTDPLEDLKAIDRVLTGYFSIIKDHSKYPIGGNADLAAALRGENAGQQAFLPADHPAFDATEQLVDRWGTPLFVHPVAGRELELRSAGPDREMFTDDDIELNPK